MRGSALAILIAQAGCMSHGDYLIERRVLAETQSLAPRDRERLALPAVRAKDGQYVWVRARALGEETASSQPAFARVHATEPNPVATAGLAILGGSVALGAAGVGLLDDGTQCCGDKTAEVTTGIVAVCLGAFGVLVGSIMAGGAHEKPRPLQVREDDSTFRFIGSLSDIQPPPPPASESSPPCALDPGWTIVREVRLRWGVQCSDAGRTIRISAGPGTLEGSRNDANDLFLRDLPAGDFSAHAELSYVPTHDGEAGLVLYQSTDDYLALMRTKAGLTLMVEQGGTRTVSATTPISSERVQLRFDRVGDHLYAYSSTDGRKWLAIAEWPSPWPKLRVGLLAESVSTVDGDATFADLAVSPLVVTTRNAPDGQTGKPYELALLTGPAGGQLKWSIADGELPPGLSLDAQTGAIAGTPATAGSYRFTVAVSDGKDQTTVDLTIQTNGP
jgi:hypothetical protein